MVSRAKTLNEAPLLPGLSRPLARSHFLSACWLEENFGQRDGILSAAHGNGQLACIFVVNDSGWGTALTRDRMLLHELAPVDADRRPVIECLPQRDGNEAIPLLHSSEFAGMSVARERERG